MRKLISMLIVLAMLVAAVPAVLAAEAQDVAADVATAEADSRYTVGFEATELGTLTIKVGNGQEAWVSDVYSFVDWTVSESVSGSAEQTYTYEITATGSYYVRIYGPNDADGLTTAITAVPYSITFTPSGVAEEPTLEPYAVVDASATAEGTYEAAMIPTAVTTLYHFAPAQAGSYKISLVSGNATMSAWSTASYGKIADAEAGELTLNATAVGQDWFLAFESEEASVRFVVAKVGEASDEKDYEVVMYENKQTPILFDEAAYEVDDFVNYTDSVVDTAVLGADGYYHLNSADGPVLYVDFFAVEPSLGTAWGYGAVSYVEYDDAGKIQTVVNYQDALSAYLMAENNEGFITTANNFHPLTEDLIEILKNVGINNNWYGDTGLVANTEDAWMFALVLMASVDGSDATEPTEPSTPTTPTTPTEPSEPTKPAEPSKPADKVETPDTGDFGVLAAVIFMAATATGAAVVTKKKEN